MNRAQRRTLLWVGVGVFAYIADLLLNVFVIVPLLGPDTIGLQCVMGLALGVLISLAAVAVWGW